ncbi:hypothetical protein PISMIDRAFT_365073 [Pisolithus microcarpus 441]|uniref:Unplaced genomic scaffold scaffold_28, whole genome shotgun sequence n=1 Tax=Pisolithus microcarpus 441 TaxID=765257 RepID=A0A0C9ZRJ2_9AGAM|nr:hypothetical protein PISMIDRAFT_365073 [Pisolithus microcarpus 441]
MRPSALQPPPLAWGIVRRAEPLHPMVILTSLTTSLTMLCQCCTQLPCWLFIVTVLKVTCPVMCSGHGMYCTLLFCDCPCFIF